MDEKQILSTNQITQIIKRNGSLVEYDNTKIADAIFKAAESVGGKNKAESFRLARLVEEYLISLNILTPHVEQILDATEKMLIEEGHAKTAKTFILYRAKRSEIRESTIPKKDIPLTPKEDDISLMFKHKSKISKLAPKEFIDSYKELYYELMNLQKSKELETHPNYLSNNDLATDIYNKKYFLKNLSGEVIEKTPEQLFARLASFIAAVEPDKERQSIWAKKFYNHLYHGHVMPGGRIIAGAGDLYRVKTLSNCFVTLIEKDNLESIYKAAYDCARTYSYGGGIGVDISALRPRDAVVHNAANHSTGAVSFMDLYSLTTGMIGQSGRRGALMLTIDVKHPDIEHFINVKKIPNWVTKQVVEQCKWSNQFNENQLLEIERQVRENTQVRFANISVKVSDEFMLAVEEEKKYGKNTYIIYKKQNGTSPKNLMQSEEYNYSFGMPSKEINQYQLMQACTTPEILNKYLRDKYAKELNTELMKKTESRDLFGDVVIELKEEEYDLAIKQAGDFILYFNSAETGEIKRLVKARGIWNQFVASNYKTAEPGLIFWSAMSKYSPSNYIGRPISCTNPCITGDSLIPTMRGLEKMKDLVGKYPFIFTDNRVPIQIKNKDGTITLLEQNQEEGSFHTVKQVWSSGVKETFKLTTKRGYELTATSDHKIMTSEGFIPLGSLTTKEQILIQKGKGIFNNSSKLPFDVENSFKGENKRAYTFNFPSYWSQELGLLLGWATGDGFITPQPDNRLGLVFAQQDQEVLEILKPFLEKMYGKKTKILNLGSTKQLRYHSKYLCNYLRQLGLKSVRAEYKTVPESIFTAPKEGVIGFLQGLFDADGTMSVTDKASYVRLTSKSQRLLKQVQVLLLNFGIISTIYDRRRNPRATFRYQTVKGELKQYTSDGILFELHISKGSARRFINEIGFIGTRNKQKIEKFLSQKQYKESFYDTIQSIVPQGKQEVFDLTEPITHSFVANGIVISNCGEIPLENGGACNLAAINLSCMVDDGFSPQAKLNWERLKETTQDTTRFLDNVDSWNEILNPLDKQKTAVIETRRIGVGLMGIADMFLQLGMDYDSEQGSILLEEISAFIANAAYQESALLAKEKSPSPIFEYTRYAQGPFFQERLTKETKELINQHGLRNIAILTVAPTGTISNIVLSYKNGNKNYIGVSGGIEPIFSLFYKRRSEQMNQGAFYNVFHSTVQAYIEKNNLVQLQNVNNLEEMRTYLPSYFFRTSHFIEPAKRVQIQGIVQKYIDHSISSTVNLPESISPEIISDIYVDAWRHGLKGITIYRDGSRYPILSIDQEITKFNQLKESTFTVTLDGKAQTVRGDEVITLPNDSLTTAFHLLDNNPLKIPLVKVEEIQKEMTSENVQNSNDPKVCKIKFEDGKLVKECAG